MKFHRDIFEEDLDEKFTSPINRDEHWTKHRKEFKGEYNSATEYEIGAEPLMAMPIDNKKVFGYIGTSKTSRQPAYVKYFKDTEEVVVYNYRGSTPYTITYYKKPWRWFQAMKAQYYVDEIPFGK